MPSLTRLEREHADYMLRDTETFWRETDSFPIHAQPHHELFGVIDAAGPDMSEQRNKPTAWMVLAPRFTYKSYGAAKAITRLVLKYGDRISIGILRSNVKEARKQLRLVKGMLTRNKKILRYFGDLSKGAEQWGEDGIVVSTRAIERSDPTVFTIGAGTSTTGNHPDFLFCDDIVTEQNCDSIEVQETLWGVIEAFQPLLPDYGAVLVTGTRWSEIDCYGRIEALNEATRKAGGEEPWQTYVREAKWQLPDGSWQYYFPAYLTETRLEDMRSKVDVRRYNAWMFNRMVDPAEKPFKPQHIHKFSGPYKFEFPYKRTITLLDPQYAGEKIRLYVVMIVDPALTDETGSCGYGLTVNGYDHRRRCFTLESRERVLLPSRAKEIICEMLLRYRPNRLIIESAGGDAWLISELGAFIATEHLDCVVQPFSALQHEKMGHRAKHQRIRAMERFVTADECFFRVADDPAKAEDYGGYTYDLLQQIDKWPSLVRNDAIDSWAMGRYALPFVPTEESEYEQELPNTNPQEWDITWTDAQGNVHGVSADHAARLAMGPPPGADAARWLSALETGERYGGSYQPGSRTRDYLARRRRAG